MKAVPSPKFEKPPIEPFTKEEVEALLKACEYCQLAETTDRRRFTMRRPTAKRDRALILTLLDTGLRASELCALKIGDVDPKTGKVQIKHGLLGGAKGGKGRTVYLGKAARRAVWCYLAERPRPEEAASQACDAANPLFKKLPGAAPSASPRSGAFGSLTNTVFAP